jgi:hypothetical protein
MKQRGHCVQNDSLFLKVLKRLNQESLLEDLILIGSWCLYVYKDYFNGSEEVPVKRTTDLDFLIPNPPRLKHNVNMVNVLKELDFIVEHNFTNQFSKFVHPDLEVEFLMNQKGRGDVNICEIKELSVTAVQLRYLSFLESNTMQVHFHDMLLRVPEPAAFTLHKYIVTGRRKNPVKAKKDLETAKEMTGFLLSRDDQRLKVQEMFKNTVKNWQKQLLVVLENEHKELFDLLH